MPSDVLSDIGLIVELDRWANRYVLDRQEARDNILASHRALATQLAAERERRESAEELLRDIPDGHLSYSQCITIACPICEHFAKYESEGSDD